MTGQFIAVPLERVDDKFLLWLYMKLTIFLVGLSEKIEHKYMRSLLLLNFVYLVSKLDFLSIIKVKKATSYLNFLCYDFYHTFIRKASPA